MEIFFDLKNDDEECDVCILLGYLHFLNYYYSTLEVLFIIIRDMVLIYRIVEKNDEVFY